MHYYECFIIPQYSSSRFIASWENLHRLLSRPIAIIIFGARLRSLPYGILNLSAAFGFLQAEGKGFVDEGGRLNMVMSFIGITGFMGTKGPHW
jgi:hypothetical protein